MTEQISTRLARLGGRLAATGLKHRDVTMRIADLEKSPHHDEVAVRRLKRERTRLEAEIQQYESILMTVSDRKSA
ncbi:MAG: DUF465 domain-containing protein [Pseudomonadota bacterium]